MTKEEYHDFMQIKKNLDRDRWSRMVLSFYLFSLY